MSLETSTEREQQWSCECGKRDQPPSKRPLTLSTRQRKVFPKVRAIDGHRGEYLLRREVEDGVELIVLTLWDSMEAIRRFAGPDPNKAVVEPEARAVLTGFDECVTHFDVVDGMAGP